MELKIDSLLINRMVERFEWLVWIAGLGVSATLFEEIMKSHYIYKP